jgi:hypothetical protein
LPAVLEGTFDTIIEYFTVDSAVSNERNLVSAVSMPVLELGKVTGLSELSAPPKKPSTAPAAYTSTTQPPGPNHRRTNGRDH